METLFLAIIAGFCLLIFCGGVYAYVKANRFIQEVTYTIEDIFSTRAQGQPTIFAQTVNEIAEGLAQRIGTSTQAAIRGSIGGSLKGVNVALEQEAIDGDPSLAIPAMLPKSLKKNPIAMVGLQMLMQKVLSKNSAPAAAQNGNGKVSQAKFSL